LATEQAVREALARVTDPEYAISIVDLGLVYGIEPTTDGGWRIVLTFTSIGCPAIEMIIEDVKAAVRQVGEVREVEVEVVWSPAWTRDRISAAGKRVLAMYGVAA
jgi:metal-sulfur cluster biosynthetic enzyme